MEHIISIQAHRFYKAKDTLNGRRTPGGYFYVRSYDGTRVRFAVSQSMTLAEVTEAGTFTLSEEDFRELVEEL